MINDKVKLLIRMCLFLKEAILEEQEKRKSKNLYVWTLPTLHSLISYLNSVPNSPADLDLIFARCQAALLSP